MIRLNLIGLIMTAVCMGAAYLIGAIMGNTSNQLMMPIAGSAMLVLDAAYRWRQSPHTGWRRWFYTQGGGWMGLPVWLTGIGFVVIGLTGG